jgi:hypothetical protein
MAPFDSGYVPDEPEPPFCGLAPPNYRSICGMELRELHHNMLGRLDESLYHLDVGRDEEPSATLENFDLDLIPFFGMVVRRRDAVTAALFACSPQAMTIATNRVSPCYDQALTHLNPDFIRSFDHAFYGLLEAQNTIRLRVSGHISPPPEEALLPF